MPSGVGGLVLTLPTLARVAYVSETETRHIFLFTIQPKLVLMTVYLGYLPL